MKNKNFFLINFLYIFFIFLSLNIFFFSTAKLEAKAFEIENIDISQPFELDFNKNDVIDKGFEIAFSKLISLIVNSKNQKKIGKTKLKEIKSMIESFSIKEEKFIDEIYYVNLGVSFNKKKIFNYLEKKNIFPSVPIKKDFLFIPIIIDMSKKDLLIFNNNIFFNEWSRNTDDTQLIQYILPTEDLEDLDLIKQKFDNIEKYDFQDITNKYNLEDSIIVLIFKNEKEVRTLSRITLHKNTILENQSFPNINLEDDRQINTIISSLKILYEDYWKNFNEINTSLKLPISVKINNSDNIKLSNFETDINNIDLVYDFYVSKFDKDFTYFQIIFNSAPNVFLKIMKNKNYEFNTQNKIWVLQ